jgi:hypothetical protein
MAHLSKTERNAMTDAVRRFLEAFDALTEPDKHQAAIEILRRVSCEGNLSETALVEAADELFRSLDAEEAARQ